METLPVPSAGPPSTQKRAWQGKDQQYLRAEAMNESGGPVSGAQRSPTRRPGTAKKEGLFLCDVNQNW